MGLQKAERNPLSSRVFIILFRAQFVQQQQQPESEKSFGEKGPHNKI